jgi:hypothetical protein
LREDFVGEIANAYVERRPPDENGGIHVKMVRLEVEATLDLNKPGETVVIERSV